MEKLDIEKMEIEITQFNKISKDIDKTIKKINETKIEIELNQGSISKEILLRKFPSQAIGSVSYYNKLNEKYHLFVDNQFNKIIRFLEHIENKEKKYRDLYLKCTENYFVDPDGIPFEELNQEKKEIDDCYQLLLVLSNEVNGDIVNFNKVYNKLEDAGLFMTVPEKVNQQYLSEISSKLDKVIQGLKVLFHSLEETNRSLRGIEINTSEISDNMYEVTSNLGDISSNLWDVSSNLKDVESSINTNNLLTGIQTYQLYKINKNTRPNKKS